MQTQTLGFCVGFLADMCPLNVSAYTRITRKNFLHYKKHSKVYSIVTERPGEAENKNRKWPRMLPEKVRQDSNHRAVCMAETNRSHGAGNAPLPGLGLRGALKLLIE